MDLCFFVGGEVVVGEQEEGFVGYWCVVVWFYCVFCLDGGEWQQDQGGDCQVMVEMVQVVYCCGFYWDVIY